MPERVWCIVRMCVPIYTRMMKSAQDCPGIVRNVSNEDDAGKAWSAAVHERIRSTVKAARDAARMSAQDVADETARLGYPISRSGIARYEGGAKLGLDVTELLVLAAALRIPPVTLLFGGHPDQPVDVLPADERATVEAIGWFCGDEQLSKEAVVEPNSYSSRLLTLTRRRANMRRTLDHTRDLIASEDEWQMRHRAANMQAADSQAEVLDEIDLQIEHLTEGTTDDE
jgi:transcriptional regulator with XRE-family HTH domain